MAKKKQTTSYKGGHIRPTKFGTFKAELHLEGKQLRKTLKTRGDAESWISDLLTSHMVGAPQLTPLEVQDARAAIGLLPAGLSLVEVVRAWVRENGSPVRSTVATEALKAMVVEKAALGRRKRHTTGLEGNVRRFLDDHPGIFAHEIDASQVKAWLTDRGIAGATWNNYRKDLHNFLAWCVHEGYVRKNLLSGFPKALTRREPPACFPVAAATAFLHTLSIMDPELVPYYAAGFFAGVRTAELDRLDGECFGKNHIHIGERQAKIAQQRYVTVQPNLREWLEKFPAQGPLRKKNHRKRFERVRDKCTVDDNSLLWVENGMRHSFASYHLAAFGDSALTSHEMGHQSATLLFSTYRTLSTKEDGEKFFNIQPPNQQEISKVLHKLLNFNAEQPPSKP